MSDDEWWQRWLNLWWFVGIPYLGESVMTKRCLSRYSGVVVVPHHKLRDVVCMRDEGHLGMHTAAPMGKVVTWIEPERLRGIAKAEPEDEQMITSPSDKRVARLSWWRRALRWVRQLFQTQPEE